MPGGVLIPCSIFIERFGLRAWLGAEISLVTAYPGMFLRSSEFVGYRRMKNRSLSIASIGL